MKTYSIIIPALNEEGYIGQLLQDIRKQEYEPLEIIVVDGNSTDTTQQIVQTFPTVKLVHTQAQVATQRNIGAEQAQGDILVFLDADVRLETHTLELLLSEFEHKQLDIACPRYIPYRSYWYIHLFYGLMNFIFILFQYLSPSGAGSCIIVKKDIIKHEEGFKDKLRFDDIEFIRRYARRYKFGILHNSVYVSDRRFRKYGFIRMIIIYFILSLFFTLGLFQQANIVQYEFGRFGKKKNYT